MRAIRTITTIGLGLAAVASMTVGSTASAVQPEVVTEGTVSSTSPLTKAAQSAGAQRFGVASYDEALKAYWTPARMRSALPGETDPAFVKEAGRYVGTTSAPSEGPVRSVAGSLPGKGVVGRSTNPNLPSSHATAFTAGKVFYTKAGVDYVCSGTIVISEGKDSVWTAGHCVHGGKGGTFHSNWTFVPAYDDDLVNPRPYGTWSAASLSTRTNWVSSSDFSVDFGVATMRPLNGVHIVDRFGGQGFTVNKGKSVSEYAFGYPSESPYDGGNLRRCQGTTKPEWDYGVAWSQTVQIPCDMTRGSSGGGWLTQYDGRVGYLNGVNSRIDRIVGPTIMLSPYFDDDAWALYEDTRNK